MTVIGEAKHTNEWSVGFTRDTDDEAVAAMIADCWEPFAATTKSHGSTLIWWRKRR